MHCTTNGEDIADSVDVERGVLRVVILYHEIS